MATILGNEKAVIEMFEKSLRVLDGKVRQLPVELEKHITVVNESMWSDYQQYFRFRRVYEFELYIQRFKEARSVRRKKEWVRAMQDCYRDWIYHIDCKLTNRIPYHNSTYKREKVEWKS